MLCDPTQISRSTLSFQRESSQLSHSAPLNVVFGLWGRPRALPANRCGVMVVIMREMRGAGNIAPLGARLHHSRPVTVTALCCEENRYEGDTDEREG